MVNEFPLRFEKHQDNGFRVDVVDLLQGRQGVKEIAGTQASSQPQRQEAVHDYVVGRNDNLWSIARKSVIQDQIADDRENHRHRKHHRVDGEQVWQRIREIVDLNREQHPELRSNPYFVPRNMHLTLPGAASTQNYYDSHQRARNHYPNSAGPIDDGGDLAHALKTEASRQAHRIGTVGDCARGPRQTFERFGIKLTPMSAVRQGELLERSGMFDRVSASDVQEGDYGYRHWSKATIRRRGLGDLGDSFIVTGGRCNALQAANDHHFVVPHGGGYYAKEIYFLRPNANFYAAYEHYKQTGQFTRLS